MDKLKKLILELLNNDTFILTNRRRKALSIKFQPGSCKFNPSKMLIRGAAIGSKYKGSIQMYDTRIWMDNNQPFSDDKIIFWQCSCHDNYYKPFIVCAHCIALMDRFIG